MSEPWTLEERLRAIRGALEAIRDGVEPLPRSSAWVLLDHLHEIERVLFPQDAPQTHHHDDEAKP